MDLQNLWISLPDRLQPAAARYANGLFTAAIIAGGLLLLAALRLGWLDVLPHESQVAETAADQPAEAPTTVVLPPEKLAAADLGTTAVRSEPIQPTRAVPATITYDAARRLSVVAPVAGVVVQVHVEPGQQVAAHQPLAVLSSPEIGLARDEVLRHEADLALAQQEQARAEQIATNVEELLALLVQQPKLEDVESALEMRTLGEYRESIVGAYSRLVLAERMLAGTETIESGALSRRVLDERRSAREVAAAQYAAARDTARFSARQARGRARADAEQAARLLAVAQQSLANLLGPLADQTPVSDRAKLSELVLLAPLAGRIEQRQAVAAARVAAGDPLFTIANTEMMWVSAEIHERDWAALDVAPLGEIIVRIPALGEVERTAKVRFVGAEVDAETRSVPLVAELANADGKLKPGMFVWALVPLAEPRPALVVPAGAIMRHESQAFVFVPAGERTFRRVDVQTGLITGDRVEITAGLSAGDTVVDRGAFFLKSELLLEREE